VYRLKNKKVVLAGILAVVVILVIIFTSSGPQDRRDQSTRSSTRSREATMPVRGIVIVPRPLDNRIVATGNVLATEEVELRSEASGKVTQVLFKEGSHVSKGDLLVKINDSDLQAQLRKAESQKTLLEEKEGRQRRLREVNAISQEQYDVSRNDLAGVKAEIDLLNAQIQKTEVRAPFSGVIGLRSISEGAYVDPSTLMARLQDLSSVKIEFSIPEKYAGMVRKGNKVRFTLESSSIQHEGTIYAVEPKIDPMTRTLRMRALARNENEAILPGSFARIEVLLGRQQDAVVVPTYAVIPDLKGQKVYLARNGRAAYVDVETGIRMEEEIQIVKGLAANDTLITTSLLQLRPGVAVSVTLEQ
jgi:membrane fusion protein (multidrug efflux system)